MPDETARFRSLIDYIEAPVIVGDPDGRAVYANPCFESRFHVSRESVKEQALAGLFAGGAREAVLRAVAGVCEGHDAVRFHLREGEMGYSALASPILTDEGRVGVVILLTDESETDEHLISFRRDVQGPIDELGRCLAELAEEIGAAPAERGRAALEDGLRALEQLRKRTSEVPGGS